MKRKYEVVAIRGILRLVRTDDKRGRLYSLVDKKFISEPRILSAFLKFGYWEAPQQEEKFVEV